MLRIVETFAITGRGTVMVLADPTELPVGRKLRAKIVRPDGTTLLADAYKEWLLRRANPPNECEAFLLRNVEKEEVPIGSMVELETPRLRIDLSPLTRPPFVITRRASVRGDPICARRKMGHPDAARTTRFNRVGGSG